LEPIGCWRLDDPRFHFDSSFLLPESREEFAALGKLHQLMPDAPITVFGHADPVGNDEYNKRLSGRRAEAVYAVITRSPAMWEALYTQPHGEDHWGPAKSKPFSPSSATTPAPSMASKAPSPPPPSAPFKKITNS
jgi:hypothetical protein